MASTLTDIEQIVSKTPDQRSNGDISKILPWFKKRADTFRTLKSDAISDIIRNCELIRRQRDNVIIQQGDRGDCFFIILSGKVSVYIQTREEDDDRDDKEAERADNSHKTEAEKSHLSICEIESLQGPVSPQELDTCSDPDLDSKPVTEHLRPQLSTQTLSVLKHKENMVQSTITNVESVSKVGARQRSPSFETVVEAFHLPTVHNSLPLDKSKYGLCIGALEDGKSFGELALLKKDCIRNASIITDTTTELLVVNRQLYNRCIRESQEKEFRAKQQFVQTSEYFENWSVKSKKQFANYLTLKTYTYGTPIVCQGIPLNHIFFLRSGQCRVIIDPTMHPSQYPSHYPINGEQEALKNLRMSCEEYVPPQIPRRRRNKGYVVRGYDICLIGNNNMIGDVEVSTNLSSYMQSVVCEQETEAFVIEIRNYERLVTRRNQATVTLITSNAMLKLANRAMRFQQIPLLRAIYQRSTKPHTMKSRKRRVSYVGDSISPVPPLGPLVDIFGPGTVFHYIRTRERQLRKAKAASKQNSIVQKSVKSQTVPEQSPISLGDSELSALAADDPTSHVIPQTSLEKLHLFEEQRMSELEARILAWHVDVEAAKTRSLTPNGTEINENVYGHLSMTKQRMKTA